MSGKLTDTDFAQKAEAAISDLEERFGQLAEEQDIDVELEGNVLTVSFEEGEPGRFIISPNSSVKQLWVSARVSSFKFDWSDESSSFVLAGTGESLLDAMTRLTREQLGDSLVVL